MPESEREGTLKILHEGHFYTSKMLLRAKDSVYWPGITNDIETTAERCHVCAINARSQQKETIKLHPVPEVAWDSLATDIFHVNNKNFIRIVDYYSRFCVVCQIHSMTSRVLVRLFTEIFSEFGFPKIHCIRWWNTIHITRVQGIYKDWQIDHYVSSPRNPQSNGLAERFVQTIKSSIIKTLQEGEEIKAALLAYRSTPLSAELFSPAELLDSRKFRSRLPMIVVQPEQHRGYRNTMQMYKEK